MFCATIGSQPQLKIWGMHHFMVFESAGVAFRFFLLFHVRPFCMFYEQSYIHRAILL
jgi:hypothetical protein